MAVEDAALKPLTSLLEFSSTQLCRQHSGPALSLKTIAEIGDGLQEAA